ncbi:hypothetical protein NDU88_001329 [Pleurodeles waltl]|uniref:Uncharacterized protein n=1 Tax=Pleurodeles waltl TaxID=8319 RepID=A0AAV7VAN5_PLEWA|nr:hypothetical protein NDU88_001329 [Pleurodeles waltl]
MSPGQPGKFAQACFVGRASGDKERWKHGAAQGGEAAVQRVVRGSGAGTIGFLWGGIAIARQWWTLEQAHSGARYGELGVQCDTLLGSYGALHGILGWGITPYTECLGIGATQVERQEGGSGPRVKSYEWGGRDDIAVAARDRHCRARRSLLCTPEAHIELSPMGGKTMRWRTPVVWAYEAGEAQELLAQKRDGEVPGRSPDPARPGMVIPRLMHGASPKEMTGEPGEERCAPALVQRRPGGVVRGH